MSRLLFCAFAVTAASLFGAPTVSDVRVTADASTRRVTVAYSLSGGPAIVTMEMLTNGVSVGEANCTALYGDVNRRVADGNGHEAVWLVDHEQLNVRLESVTALVKAWSDEAPPDYLVVGLDGPKDVRYFTSDAALPGGVGSDDYRTRYLVLRRIPAAGARRRLGCSAGENGTYIAAQGVDTRGRETARTVNFTNDFWMAIYPVTQDQWMRVSRKGNTSNNQSSRLLPVEGVKYTDVRPTTWPSDQHIFNYQEDSETFCSILRYRSGVEFDLPTDAQWEFACRAGTDSALYDGNGLQQTEKVLDPNLDKLAWYGGNSKDSTQGEGSTHVVGKKQPNPWGLYDLYGNVWELVLDLGDGTSTVSGEEMIEPVGLTSATPKYRQRRGGCFYAPGRQCRSAFRAAEPEDFTSNSSGFRVVAPIGLKWNR